MLEADLGCEFFLLIWEGADIRDQRADKENPVDLILTNYLVIIQQISTQKSYASLSSGTNMLPKCFHSHTQQRKNCSMGYIRKIGVPVFNSL